MAIIYSYPTVTPTVTDLILGTDISTTNKSTKNFTVQSIIDLQYRELLVQDLQILHQQG